MPEQDDGNWRKVAALGMEVAVGIGLGALIGAWIDRKFNTDPWGILIGSGLGFVTGMYLLIKEAIRVFKD